MGTKSLKSLNTYDFTRIIKRFYNDTYTMDQKGCSSPQAIVWLGKENKKIKEKFYKLLSKIAINNFDQNLAVTNEKISKLSLIAANSKLNFKLKFKNFNLVVVKLKNFNTEIEKIRPYNGTFVEINTNNLREIKKIISKKCQTVTYFGIESKKIKNFVIESGLSGVDRIVPVGRALDMNLIWDGKDLIFSLSRIIAK